MPKISIGASTIAVFVWIAGTALAVLVVRAIDLNPLTVRGAVLPIPMAAIAGAVLLGVALRWPTDRVTGVVAGLYAAWLALVQISALHGTPFAQSGEHNGDWSRLTSLANRLSTTWGSADAFLPGLPSEYPPLYPWVVGHLADVVHRPVWAMVKPVQILVLSGSVVVAFALWRRLVSAPLALAMAAVAPAVYTLGYKDYEIISLAAFVPYLLAAFTDRPRSKGGLHWLPAGIIGGLIATTYIGYVLFGAAAVLALVVARLLRPDRRAYLLHLLGVVVTAAVVASWYLVPLAVAYLTRPREQLSDTYPNKLIASEPVPTPFLEPTVIGVLALIGLAGMIWYRRRVWWAEPMLLISGGIALYWGAATLSTVVTGHTFYLPKAPRMIDMALLVGGILTVAQAAGPIARRLTPDVPRALARSMAIGGIALLLVVGGLTCWQAWTPGNPRGFVDFSQSPAYVTINPATKAHLETLPSGRLPRYTPPHRDEYSGASPVLPADLIRKDVERRLGPTALPMTLSVDSRIFMYVHWYCYLEGSAYASLSLAQFNGRDHELRKLSAISDPTTFATASAHTRFGPIDVFILRKHAGKWWYVNGIGFTPDAFRSSAFDIVDDLPSDLVLVIRHPGG